MSATARPSPPPNSVQKRRRKLSPKVTRNPRSKMLKLPDIHPPELPKLVDQDEKALSGKQKNPFHMPSDVEVFAMREEERRIKKEAKDKMKTLSIYNKNTTKRKNLRSLLAEDEDDIQFYEHLRKRDSDKILINQRTRADRHFGKENLHDFIAKKREMFLVQYALGVKREEMRKLEEIAQAEEQKLLDDEKALEEDAAKFDAFLKENDKNSVEAIKRAEMETKAKLEKIQEIKRQNVQIMSIRSEMSKNEDQLKDLQRYKQFLDKLTPREFFESKPKVQRQASEAQSRSADSESNTGMPKDGKSTAKPGGASRTPGKRSSKDATLGTRGRSLDNVVPATPAEGLENDEEVEEFWESEVEGEGGDESLYFASPQQLLDIFTELEENNLALIQNCQETEETLEELRQKIVDTEAKMETLSLKQQIEFLNSAIAREEEKAKSLEERARLFSPGLMGAESQEQMLSELNVKVKEVYRKCIGDNDANLSTLQMLTNVENRLEQLFEIIEMMPPDRVEHAEKMKDKERRQRLREEKMEAQRILQEERVQRALERARAPVKKKTGKLVVFRSAPPQKKKKAEEDDKIKEEEDLEYYGVYVS
ncbi:hypothetical protein BJ742DRAFT_764473 [Cladochytrium replicatum]|nr:hypothetical protein BJ742DRAFT_764473 [Cladochytrium replicatum]